MKNRECLLVAWMLLAASPCAAADKSPMPDQELLEFLGGFETARGKAIDPFAFAEADRKEARKQQPAKREKDTIRRRKPEKTEQKDNNHEE